MDNLPVHPSAPTALVPHQPLAATRYPDHLVVPDDSDERGGLLEYWSILRRRKGTVIIVAFIGGLIGYLVTLPQTPIYQAKTTLEIETLNQNFLNMKEVNPVNQGGTSSETIDIQTQIRILQSQSLIERVVAKLHSGGTPKQAPSRIETWRKALNLPESALADDYRTAVSTAARNLKVRSVGSTRIIDLTVDSTDPTTAATFANTLTREYIEQNLESRWNTTQKTTEWLGRQIDDMRVKLERSEDKLQQYARQAGLIFTDEKTNISEQKLSQVQEALTSAQTDRIGKQSRYETANSSPAEALPDILNDPGLREYSVKLTDIRRQIAELTSTFTPDYPKVKRLQAQYNVIEAEFVRERAAILKKIRNEYDESSRRERILADNYTQQAKLVAGLGENAIQYNILKREVDSNRQLYDTMLQQLKQANISAALRASNIRVVDLAKPPAAPYKPNANNNALVGLMGGLFLGAAFVLMRNRADRSIQEPGDSPFYLKVPELGIIPSAQAMVRRRITAPALEQRLELTTWQNKASALAESYRSTLISVMYSAQNGHRPRVLLLTSAGPAEGKSTTVANLAIAISEVGQKVLLIDGDLRKPRMHSIFEIDAAPGLSEVLKRSDSGPVDWSAYIRPTQISNLFVLPSGKSTSTATTLLYGPNMASVARDLRAQFDTILIDTPPMLQIPDARILAAFADKVILVVRSGKTTKDAATAAIQRFREDGISVLGTILNDWNPKHSPVGYYGYYGRYYRQYQQYYQPTHNADADA